MPEQQAYGPLELPSGKQIRFRAPIGADRANVLALMKITPERAISDAMLVDDYVAAKCLTEVDGQPTDGDYKHTFDKWPQQDILFYRGVFDEMFGLNEGARNKIKAAADFLLKGQTSTGGCSSPESAS